MATFDQPTSATVSVPNPITDINFRTNAFPTLAVTGNGKVFAAWQERVDITSDSGSFSFGRPDPDGSPRIVVMKSTDEGDSWTDIVGNPGTRRAIDFGDRDGDDSSGPCEFFDSTPEAGFGVLAQCRPSGPQMKPRLVFGGGRLLLGYTESRGLLTTDLVLAETDFLVLRRLGPAAERAFLDQILAGALTREPVVAADLVRAREVLAQFADQDFGLTDATLMTLAERLRIPVLTLDRRHFDTFRTKQGERLTLLP